MGRLPLQPFTEKLSYQLNHREKKKAWRCLVDYFRVAVFLNLSPMDPRSWLLGFQDVQSPLGNISVPPKLRWNAVPGSPHWWRTHQRGQGHMETQSSCFVDWNTGFRRWHVTVPQRCSRLHEARLASGPVITTVQPIRLWGFPGQHLPALSPCSTLDLLQLFGTDMGTNLKF